MLVPCLLILLGLSHGFVYASHGQPHLAGGTAALRGREEMQAAGAFSEAELQRHRKLLQDMKHEPARSLDSLDVMVGMIGRDVAYQLPYSLSNVYRLSKLFKHTSVVFVENDSQDNTRIDFQAWVKGRSSEKLSGEILSLPPERRGEKRKLSLLGEARNVYLNALREPRYKHIDYLLVVDTDMCFPWDIGVFKDTLEGFLPESGKQWHGLLANGVCSWRNYPRNDDVKAWSPGAKPRYCDRFALFTNSTTVASGTVFFSPSPLSVGMGSCEEVYPPNSIECKYINGHAAIPVNAGFGGVAFYRADMIRHSPCYHVGDDKVYSCEHNSVGFCLTHMGYKLVIAPKLMINWEGCHGPVLEYMPDVPDRYYSFKFSDRRLHRRRRHHL